MIELKRAHAIGIVALAACAVYANSLWNGFAYDDLWIILRNDRVHQLRDMSRIWLTPYWPSFGEQLGLYRPFAIFAFAVEWAISGGAPWFFHLVNVLLHAAATVLLFLLIEHLFTRTAATAGALVFAIHPVHTEAVANVVGQNELWAAVGVLTACLIYTRRPAGQSISWRRAVAILLCFVLALLAKESAVVLPGLLVLLDFVQRRVQLHRDSMARYARGVSIFLVGFVLLFGAYLLLRYRVLGSLAGTDAAPGLPHLSEEHRVLNALRAWPEFVRLLFFPLELSVDYSPGVVLPVESVTPMVALGALLVITVVALSLATPFTPRAGLIAAWFLLTILPVSNFFFPIGVLIAERTLYLPSIAVCFLAGFVWDAATRTAERETRRLAAAVAIIMVAFFSVRTVVRNPDWDSLNAVWRGLRRDHPESYRAQWVNAVTAWRAGRLDLAERYYQLAYRIWPRDSQLITEWANFYIGQGKWDTAIALLERSRDMTPFVPKTHEFLAYAYLYGGRPQDALRSARHANQMAGAQRGLNLFTIAEAHDKLGQYEEAAAAWGEQVKLKGGDTWLNWAMLARAQARMGDTASATASAARAAALTGSDARAARTARDLRHAVVDGCYQSRQPDCDPLRDWRYLVQRKPPAIP